MAALLGALRYLLDTNALSQSVRDPYGLLATKLAKQRQDTLCTSVVVACEVQFGVCGRVSERIRGRMVEVLAQIPALPLESPVELHYGEIRAFLQQAGTPISSNDLLIAAQARSLGLVVVTNNTREFSRVPGLVVEDWSVAP